MARPSRFTIAALVVGLLVAGRGRIGRFLRTIDQRAGIFAPHGAGIYNAVAPRLLRPLYRRVADEVAASGAVYDTREISAVLEIGSGPGELALEIADRLARAEVVGIDLAEVMVGRAGRRARAAQLEGRVRFQVADAAALPFADGTFDIVVSTLSLHHWADPARVFAEIGRILRPRGIALVFDLRTFAYTHHELEMFFAGGPFEGTHFEREPVETGVLGLFFVRIRLVRPTEG